jgi:Leucine-rich repeat (LRR) protein
LELCSTQLENLPTDFSLHFPNLVILYLGGNYLGDITPLAGCSQLQKLVLVDNRLDNLKTLNLTLKQLHSLSYLDLRSVFIADMFLVVIDYIDTFTFASFLL